MMADLEKDYLPFEAVQGRTLGVDVLLPKQVADQCKARGWSASERSVERWIAKAQNSLPAVRATVEQARMLGYYGNIGGNGIFFVRVEDMEMIPVVRKYPKDTKRTRRKQRVPLGKTPEN
jgi:hypothetical protein